MHIGTTQKNFIYVICNYWPQLEFFFFFGGGRSWPGLPEPLNTKFSAPTDCGSPKLRASEWCSTPNIPFLRHWYDIPSGKVQSGWIMDVTDNSFMHQKKIPLLRSHCAWYNAYDQCTVYSSYSQSSLISVHDVNCSVLCVRANEQKHYVGNNMSYTAIRE